ncbi:MAG: hypothetical protein OEY97_11990 [Nitrospirota bacterium]|nr:hypothetical protein [Nitrospirota bacterium]
MPISRHLSIAMGAAAAAAISGGATAADLGTVNGTASYADPAVAASFLPAFLASCAAPAGGTSTASDTITMHMAGPACSAHGNRALMAAAEGRFFQGAAFVVPFGNTENSGYSTLTDPGFDNGLFDAVTGSYFNGLNLAWVTQADADRNQGGSPSLPMGAPTTTTANQRTEWVDQLLLGYVTSIDTNGVPDDRLNQEFASGLSWMGGLDPASAKAVIDQRLAQQVALGGEALQASRQTFQQAIRTLSSGSSATTSPDLAMGNATDLAQMVAQDVEGYLFSCLNCDTAARIGSGGSHAFAPADWEYAFVPYVSNWNTVPTITRPPG